MVEGPLVSSTSEPVASTSKPTPEGHEYAFGGPYGGLAMMALLPLLSLYLWISIHRYGGSLVIPALSDIPAFTPRALGYFLLWLAFQIALQVILPGRTVKGLKGKDGVTLEYKLNGFLSLWVSLAAVGGLVAAKVIRFSDIVAELGALLLVAIAASFALAAFLYLYGFSSDRVEHRTGNKLYDFFMGTALNPRVSLARAAETASASQHPGGMALVEGPTAGAASAGPMTGGFDIKLFFESKIGMTTWLVVTMAMAGAQWERDGAISLSMGLVLFMQLLYVADFYFFEAAMLSTWDINNENLGFMLMFGFVVWMPFNFSLQAQYLFSHSVALPIWAAVGIVLLNLLGYIVFRTSNLQKHRFRTESDPRIWGKPAEYLQTQRGTKLLTSGWWGLSRHANYFGDITMALAWCLPCAFSHITPYFYFIYFAPLLIDRERRDHRACQRKYGEDWTRYCKKVPYRIIPYVY